MFEILTKNNSTKMHAAAAASSEDVEIILNQKYPTVFYCYVTPSLKDNLMIIK